MKLKVQERGSVLCSAERCAVIPCALLPVDMPPPAESWNTASTGACSSQSSGPQAAFCPAPCAYLRAEVAEAVQGLLQGLAAQLAPAQRVHGLLRVSHQAQLTRPLVQLSLDSGWSLLCDLVPALSLIVWLCQMAGESLGQCEL